MPKRAITLLFLDRITPPKTGRVEYWDKPQPGLALRVSATGAKSWIVMYRVEGKQVRETLGTLAKIPNVEEARRRAAASLEQVREGVNPVNVRRTAEKQAALDTVAAAAESYLKRCERELAAKTRREYGRIFNSDILPRWGSRPLAEITKGDVLEIINDKASSRQVKRRGASPDGAVVQANKVLELLQTFFSWSQSQDLVAGNPTNGVRRPTKEVARDRVLTDDEICAFWRATEISSGRLSFWPLFRLLLLTAQRKGEVAGMRWTELDLDKQIWTIPAARSKNGKPHIVHLSVLAMEVLTQVERKGELVFSGRFAGREPVGFSVAKTRLDAAMGAEDWTLHDLRRTATTGMARLGIAPHVADRVLNHQAGTIRGVAAVYNRFEYLPEREAALEAWGRFVEALVHPGARFERGAAGRARVGASAP